MTRRVNRIRALAWAGLLAMAGGAAQAAGLTVALPDDAGRAVIAAYARSVHVPMRIVRWNGDAAALRQAQAAHRWDVVWLGDAALAAGCADGVLLRDPSGQCGAPAAVREWVPVWKHDKLPGNPGWAGFWDVARLPGKRGLHMGARGNLEIALSADGVPPNEVYRQLATEDGIARAFRKLDQLRPYLVWWRQPAEAMRLVGSGAALMTSAEIVTPAAAADTDAGAEDCHTPICMQRGQGLLSTDYLAVLAGSAHGEAGLQLLRFAASATPKTRSLLTVDAIFWQQHGAVLEARFANWAAR